MLLNGLDWTVIAAFFAMLVAIPALASLKTRKGGGDEYFRGANSMPWWLIGVSMVAATTSTNSANLFTEIIRRDGLSGNWVWWAFLTTGMLTVFVYSKLWVRSGATTDIAFYELRYSGRPAAFLRGFRALYLGVVYNLVVMATVLLGAIKIGCVMFGGSRRHRRCLARLFVPERNTRHDLHRLLPLRGRHGRCVCGDVLRR